MQTIEQLMVELGLDPNNQQERAMLEGFISHKPIVEINQEFILELRKQILIESKGQGVPHLQSNNKLTNFMKIFTKQFLAPAAVALVVVIGGVWYITQDEPSLVSFSKSNQILSSKYSVAEVGEGFFGDLAKVSIVAGGQGAGGFGGGGADQNSTETQILSDQKRALLTNGVEGVELYEYPEIYKFEYVGDELAGLEDSYGVYKRLKPEQPESIISRLLRLFSFGLIDLSRFNNVQMQYFSFIEDRDFGLGAGVDFINGAVNIYQNWEKWPQPPYNCSADQCEPIDKLTPDDMIPDGEAITIAEQFMQDYGISKDGYGKAIISPYSDWRIQYENALDKSSFYYPETITVLYPLLLEDRVVYDESGFAVGIGVSIDVRHRRVAGVWGLETKQFQKSNYVGETNAQRLLSIAGRGGYNSHNYINEGRIVTLKLGTPTIELIKIWYSPATTAISPAGGLSEELYVPALVFPILDGEKYQYWRKNIIVPLASDVLNNEYKPYSLEQ